MTHLEHRTHLNTAFTYTSTAVMNLEEVKRRADRMTVRIEVYHVRTMFKAFYIEKGEGLGGKYGQSSRNQINYK